MIKEFQNLGTILEIKNNKINIEYLCKRESHRTNGIIKMIQKSIDYIKKKNMNYPNTKLFVLLN